MKASSVLFIGLLTCLSAAGGADDVSGPGRTTLSDEAWGTVFYVPSHLVTYRYTRNTETGVREMKSNQGKVTISETGIGSYEVAGPKHKLTVEGTSQDVKVHFDKGVYTFSHSPAGLKIVTPKGAYNYTNVNEDITASGPFGKTMIRNKNGRYMVTSPKGEYSYTPLEDGGFEVKGGPLRSHPGLYRGATFTVDGIGVFIDFRKMDPDNALFRFLEFQPQLEYK